MHILMRCGAQWDERGLNMEVELGLLGANEPAPRRPALPAACCVNTALSFVSVYLLIFWHHTSALLYGFIMPPLIGSGRQAGRQGRQGSDGSPRMFQMFDKRAAVLPADTTHTY